MLPGVAWHMAGTEKIFVGLKFRASILPAKLFVVKEKAHGWGMGSLNVNEGVSGQVFVSSFSDRRLSF